MSSPILASLFLLSTSSPPSDLVREALSAHSDRMFRWLVISSIVTSVGVILEAPAEFHELARWLKLRRSNKKVGFRVPITFLGLVIVVTGIVGEGIFEFLSSDAETAIRQHDEGLLTDAIRKAGTAFDRAVNAEEQTSKEIAARLQLEAEIAGRRLSDEQKKVLIRSMARFSGQVAHVRYQDGDREGYRFCVDIGLALRAAGLRVLPPEGWGVAMPQVSGGDFNSPFPTIFPGISIESDTKGDDARTKKARSTLIREFANLGFEAVGRSGSTSASLPNRLYVDIGPRPFGAQGEAKLRIEAETKKHKNNNP